jgi:hypothetical protein
VRRQRGGERTIQLLGLETLVPFTVEIERFHSIMLVKSQSALFFFLICKTITGIFAPEVKLLLLHPARKKQREWHNGTMHATSSQFFDRSDKHFPLRMRKTS